MKTLPWFQENIYHWLKLVKSQKVPHAILLSGPKGLGKFDFAKNMAHIALCENLTDQGACQDCSACHLYKSGNHTDLAIISAEKMVIKVDQIRKLTRDVMLSSTRGQYKVIIIENAEQMNNASANALLKTLEEPPKKTLIFLTTSEIGRLLPTIKSRCIKTPISTPNQTQGINWLKQEVDHTQQDLELALLLVTNAPIQALEILKNDKLQLIKKMVLDLENLMQDTVSLPEVSENWKSDEYLGCLLYVASYYFNLLKSKIKGDSTLSSLYAFTKFDDYSKIKNFETKIISFIQSIYLLNKRQATALKTELLIDELLINWKKQFKIEK